MAKKILVPLDMSGNHIIGLRAENLASLPMAGTKGRLVYRTSDDTVHYDNGSTWIQVGVAGTVSWSSISGKPTTIGGFGITDAYTKGEVDSIAGGKANTSHTHIASQITDLQTAVNTYIAAYFDAATADETRDTLNELIALITSNESAIATLQAKTGKFAATGPSSSSTSWAVTHNLNSTDVVVSVYEIATNEQVLCDVTRTSANVVTLGFGAAVSTNALRVVVIG